jgi:hypothetical protein
VIRENWKRLGQMKQQETPLKFQSLSLKNPSEIYPAESSADVDAKSTCMLQIRKTRIARKVPGSQKGETDDTWVYKTIPEGLNR